ncbi:unnamed protein product [Pieris macdunnoughi]|uniref:Uncharacterized protein n=1 Tax=Pieris macdunnoughi TaxID=345717 RepID=A0A821PYQ9_9NEOP|nr:unnamed protein product [Pieris macdunnoughi]
MSEKSDILKEISDLTKKRSSYKGQVTTFIGYLSSFESSSPPEQRDFGELELRVGRLDSLYAKFDDVQTRLECICDDVTYVLEEREEFEKRYFKTLSQAQKLSQIIESL